MSPGGEGLDLSAVHSRFARAVLLIYLGTAVVAVGLLVAALATDLAYSTYNHGLGEHAAEGNQHLLLYIFQMCLFVVLIYMNFTADP